MGRRCRCSRSRDRGGEVGGCRGQAGAAAVRPVSQACGSGARGGRDAANGSEARSRGASASNAPGEKGGTGVGGRGREGVCVCRGSRCVVVGAAGR